MNVAIIGTGTMGKLLKNYIEDTDGIFCVAMIDPRREKVEDFPSDIDVIIDFSHPANLSAIEVYATKNNCALVIGTTGHTPEEVLRIRKISGVVPVFYAATLSIGSVLLKKMAVELSEVLSNTYDIEIIEKCHNSKLDAPSGIAKMLADEMDPNGIYEQVHGRKGEKKRNREIGIHSVRCGGIVGEHTVIFAGSNEIIEIKHSMVSKDVITAGAIQASRYVYGKEAGLYDMNDVLFGF